MDIQIQKAHRVSKRVKLETGEGLTEQAHKDRDWETLQISSSIYLD